jgi:hypothetical protein
VRSEIDPRLVDSVLFLFGDIGRVSPELLAAYVEHLKTETLPKTIIFLGDNVYPAGIEDGEKGVRSRRFLTEVLNAFLSTGSRIIVIPGNHDWDFHSKEGANAVVRQQKLVDSLLPENGFFPQNACPGPAIALETKNLSVLALDTQWFLHSHSKPSLDSKQCYAAAAKPLALRFKELSSDIGRGWLEILALHHPLKSYGSHGLNSGCPHDMGCPENVEMVKEIHQALPPRRAIRICVSGHDHSLQVLRGDEKCLRYLVSGSGSKKSRVSHRLDTHFAESEYGFMELRVSRKRRAELKVYAMRRSTDRSYNPELAFREIYDYEQLFGTRGTQH